jgi:PAS domain S-box-containing protein
MKKARAKRERDRPMGLGVRTRCARLSLEVLGILFCALTGPAAVAQQSPKNVLIMLSATNGNEQLVDSIESAIRARVLEPVTFYTSYNTYRVLYSGGHDSYYDSQAETFRLRYAEVNFDLVIAVSAEAIELAKRFRDKMFPGVPIVFTMVDPSEPGAQPGPGITGLTIAVGLPETIDLALHLHPDTRTVAVISPPDTYWLRAAHSELLRRSDRVKEVDFVEPASRELLAKISALPPHTVVLFQLSPDLSQPEFGGWQLLDAVAQRWPTYSPWDTLCLSHGCIGGAYGYNPPRDSQTAEIAAKVLSGERPEDIPVVHDHSLRVQVDWPALQHWHIPESALPPGSIILNRPPTMWQQYRNYILVAIAVIVAQALLIVALLWQRTRKRKAEAILRESEKRFRVMADATPSLIWMCDAQGKLTYLNEQRLAFTGPDPDAGYGDTWFTFIHPDDVKGVLDALWQALRDQRPFSKEYRLHRNDGTYRWMFDVASPRVNGDGSFAGFIGSAIDVTDQKLARQALENVSGQLIEAQEKERSRIARDLHDDICQRLAVLSMELEQIRQVPTDAVSTAKDLEEIRRHCSEIAGDVQSLSHELHSSKLEYLGVVAAVRGFCREFSKKHGGGVDFTDSKVPLHLPKDISLCLFRVAQEALHNAVKYSGTDKFTVDLSAIPGEVRLEVADAGIGFDIETAKKNRGLGLVSMQERVHLVRGRFAIESKPGRGTKVLAFVPLIAENERASESEDRDLEDTASMQQTS